MYSLTVILLLFVTTSPMGRGASPEERKKMIEKIEKSTPSQEAKDRKDRSGKRLESESVPVNSTLPVIEDSSETKIRTKEEIAHRAIALCLCSLKAEGLEQAKINSLVTKFEADTFFSPSEATFINDPEPPQKDRIKFSWGYESYWVMLWSLGYIDGLGRPDNSCDPAKAVAFLKGRDTAQFIKDARLRSIGEILDETDLIYRYHWATDEARMNSKKPPAKLDPDVIMERHHSLNWLVRYMNEDWDNVSTDT